MSRLECLAKGAPYTYAALAGNDSAAPGQWTVSEMSGRVYGSRRFISSEITITFFQELCAAGDNCRCTCRWGLEAFGLFAVRGQRGCACRSEGARSQGVGQRDGCGDRGDCRRARMSLSRGASYRRVRAAHEANAAPSPSAFFIACPRDRGEDSRVQANERCAGDDVGIRGEAGKRGRRLQDSPDSVRASGLRQSRDIRQGMARSLFPDF